MSCEFFVKMSVLQSEKGLAELKRLFLSSFRHWMVEVFSASLAVGQRPQFLPMLVLPLGYLTHGNGLPERNQARSCRACYFPIARRHLPHFTNHTACHVWHWLRGPQKIKILEKKVHQGWAWRMTNYYICEFIYTRLQ